MNSLSKILVSFGITALVILLTSTCEKIENAFNINSFRTTSYTISSSSTSVLSKTVCYIIPHHDDEPSPNYPKPVTTPPYNSLATIGITGPAGTTTTTL